MQDKKELLFSPTEEGRLFREEKTLWEQTMEEAGLTYDYLPSTSIYMYQRKDMFRNNTDTARLGQFMEVRKQESVLDIGTNNGALLLYASCFSPSKLIGVDVQKEACELAKENMRLHELSEISEIIHGDIKDVKNIKVDVIVCNPPYFDYDDPRVNSENKRNKARHQMGLTLEDFAFKSKELLKEKGRLYMVHRADYLAQIIQVFVKQKMEIKKVQFIHHKVDGEARSVLVEIRKAAKPGCRVMAPIILQK